MLTQSTTDYSASVRIVAASHRLATYERVSGDKQEKEDTIENQTMALEAAVAACGGHIVERYRETIPLPARSPTGPPWTA